MTRAENNILLFSVTLCWSASYLFIKSLPEDLSPFAYLTMTAGIAAAVMAVLFRKRLKRLTASIWRRGFLLSLLLSLNLLAEKQGIGRLAASSASFLSALTILMVPLLLLLFHRRPAGNQLLGTAVILGGLCLCSCFQRSSFTAAGTLYMLAACFFSAVYTIAADRYAKEEDPLLICLVQMFFTAATGYLLWLGEDPATFRSVRYTKELLSSIFILAFFTKAYAYIALMYAQKYTNAISVTVIASTEPVVTLILALLLPAAYGGEQSLQITAAAGAAVIMAGAVVAGLPPSGRKGESETAGEPSETAGESSETAGEPSETAGEPSERPCGAKHRGRKSSPCSLEERGRADRKKAVQLPEGGTEREEGKTRTDSRKGDERRR